MGDPHSMSGQLNSHTNSKFITFLVTLFQKDGRIPKDSSTRSYSRIIYILKEMTYGIGCVVHRLCWIVDVLLTWLPSATKRNVFSPSKSFLSYFYNTEDRKQILNSIMIISLPYCGSTALQ